MEKIIYFNLKCPYCDKKVKMRVFPKNGIKQALPYACDNHVFFLFYNDGEISTVKNLEDFKG